MRSLPSLFSGFRGRGLACGVAVWLLGGLAPGRAQEADRTLADFSREVSLQSRTAMSFVLEGTVAAVAPERNWVALQDASATTLLELPELPADLAPGCRVRVSAEDEGVSRGRFALQLGTAPVVEMDGLHSELTRSGSVQLREGLQPFLLDWFNGFSDSALKLEYEGPGISRQEVPAGVFFHTDASGAAQPGLRFQSYAEDDLLVLPDFARLKPVAEGICPVPDLERRSRVTDVALRFRGLLRVPASGAYRFHLTSDDGARLRVGAARVLCRILDRGETPTPVAASPNSERSPFPAIGRWVTAEAATVAVEWIDGRIELELANQDASFRATLADPVGIEPESLQQRRLRITGIGRAEGVLVVNAAGIEDLGPVNRPADLLTRIGQIRRLQPDEARRPYRAKVRGVVTMAEPAFLVVQDATGGVFTHYASEDSATQPRAGELWELEGVTHPGDFSPVLVASSATYLGSGTMPEAVRPTWDQLASGSLDAERVELEGVVLSASDDGIELLTRDGTVRIDDRWLYRLPFRRWPEEGQRGLAGSIVRIRGVYTASWDSDGRVRPAVCKLGNGSLTIDEPAPADPFAAPALRATDLLRFTSHSGSFKRVKVPGLVLHVRPPEVFLSDGFKGLRVVCQEVAGLRPGDRIEAAGFPRLGGPSPVLLEASIRKTGEAPLPEAVSLFADRLAEPATDSSWVRMTARLLSDSLQQQERVLELQAGSQRFVARLAVADEAARDRKPFTRGSLLQLTGVYAATDRLANPAAEPFELLLNGADDIVLLERGPWWTPRHILATMAILACALLLALVWGIALRRTVNERGKQLAREIEDRQTAERHRAMEQERSRMAQDLHDELGSGLTEAGFLASLARNPAIPPAKKDTYLGELSQVCSDLVTGLDEIVWAVNPRYDSAVDLAGYCSLFAQRFLGLAGLSCRLAIEDSVADHPLDSRQRHSLFLAFKEALTNIARHAKATEVRLTIKVEEGELLIALHDDGCGMAMEKPAPDRAGLSGMTERMLQLGGSCRIVSSPGAGTTVELRLPLKNLPPESPPERSP